MIAAEHSHTTAIDREKHLRNLFFISVIEGGYDEYRT
jgi:hypothetical protein